MDKYSNKKNYEKVPLEIREGIDLDLITSEYSSVVEELICPICSSLVLDAVACKKCEKPFCKFCIHTWLKKKNSCPNRCTTFVETELPRLLRNMINKIKAKCIYHKLGCNEVILYENYIKHIETCEFAEWRCLEKNCKYVNIKSKVIDHCNTQCGKLLDKCKNCGETINPNELKIVKSFENQVIHLKEEIKILKTKVNQNPSNSLEINNNSNRDLPDLYNILNNNVVSLTSFISSGIYAFNNKIAGTNKVEDLYDRSLLKGNIIIK